jgi:hypothetical protein
MMSTALPPITKQHYLSAMQCKKFGWHQWHDPSALATSDPAREDRLQTGREVGAIARRLFPTGVQVMGISRVDALSQTETALLLRQPLFEAAFEAEGCFTRTDILVPVDEESWDLFEVKSGTSVEDVYVEDIAFQAHVLAAAGVRVRSYSLLLVDNTYVREGEINPNSLFIRRDVTTPVFERMHRVKSGLQRTLETIALSAVPKTEIGRHCDQPYLCPLKGRCWTLPPHNVTELVRGGDRAFDLLASGVSLIGEIPEDAGLTERQRIQREAVITRGLHVDVPAVQEFLERLEWPLHFLDFESFATAIPLIDGVRPYEQIIFQSSIHLLSDVNGEPEHHSFLAEGRHDPRPELLRHLREKIGDRGSVIVYNQQFEEGRLRECAEAFPEHRAWIDEVIPRMVDLLVPFREFSVYYPEQHGSCSIKNVLQPLTGQSYSNLAIQDGTTASREFLRVTWSECAEEEHQRVRRDLLAYCGLDTGGMVAILERLRALCAVCRLP